MLNIDNFKSEIDLFLIINKIFGTTTLIST